MLYEVITPEHQQGTQLTGREAGLGAMEAHQGSRCAGVGVAIQHQRPTLGAEFVGQRHCQRLMDMYVGLLQPDASYNFV